MSSFRSSKSRKQLNDFMKRILVLLGVSLFAVSCKTSLETYMVGKWESVYVDFHFQKEDGTVEKFTVDFNDTEDPRTKIKAYSEYIQDGTFSAHYQNEKGEKIEPTTGTWTIVKDSLRIQYGQVDAMYKIIPTSYGFEAYSYYDFDHNGKVDTLFMKSKRIESF